MNPRTIWSWSCWAYRRRMIIVARFLKFLNYVLFHAILPYQAEIEKDIVLEHYALGVVVHPNVTIGHRVRIYHHVTLATRTWVGSPHRIFIGDDVVIGVGATLISKEDASLHIGNAAKIGAGAVVTHDVSPCETVVGVPAKPVSKSDHEWQ